MSADAWLQEPLIGQTILPQLRRTAELSALPIPDVPTRFQPQRGAGSTCGRRLSPSIFWRPPEVRWTLRANLPSIGAQKLTEPPWAGGVGCGRPPVATSRRTRGKESATNLLCLSADSWPPRIVVQRLCDLAAIGREVSSGSYAFELFPMQRCQGRQLSTQAAPH